MNETVQSNTHAVLLSIPELAFDEMIELSDKLEAAIQQAGAGAFDGNEIGGGEITLFMYGPDADVLLASIQPVLESEKALHGGKILLRYGAYGAPEREVIVGKSSLQ